MKNDALVFQNYQKKFPHTVSMNYLMSSGGVERQRVVALLQKSIDNDTPLSDFDISPGLSPDADI